MRHAASRRHRHRGHHGNNNNGGQRRNNNRMQVFDSNGPEVRIRGTAYQVVEKYQSMAKDAASAGDPVLAESYLQHAEHYQRIISTWDEDDVQRNPQGYQQHVSHDQPQRVQHPQQHQRNEDLALPSSILGGTPKAEYKDEQAVRAEEMAS